ncbi:hypothetical protein ACFLSJ_03160 [Verrucomicrobiota bacterium]
MTAFSYDMAKFLTFQDKAACEKARQISREDICKHPNENVSIRVIENDEAFRLGFIVDIVAGIKRSLDEGRDRYVIILPAPNPQYAFAAHMINELRIPCHHVHTFNMDEYADQDGNTAPREWQGGFQYWMWHDFFGRIDPELRMPEEQIHFPTTETRDHYSRMLEDLGGAERCYGGIGWCGHIAFVEPHLAEELGDDMDAFLRVGTRTVELNPITVMQNCLYADAGSAGDWSWCPPKAVTIGPRDVAGAKLRSSWNGFGCGESVWQRFIVRLAMHGPVTPRVPASMLQLFDSEVVLSGAVAAGCDPNTSERRSPIEF